jgi:hypothetical protein
MWEDKYSRKMKEKKDRKIEFEDFYNAIVAGDRYFASLAEYEGGNYLMGHLEKVYDYLNEMGVELNYDSAKLVGDVLERGYMIGKLEGKLGSYDSYSKSYGNSRLGKYGFGEGDDYSTVGGSYGMDSGDQGKGSRSY